MEQRANIFLSVFSNSTIKITKDPNKPVPPEHLIPPKCDSANFSGKGRIANILGFAANTQLCHCSMKATTDNIQMNGCGCVP